MAEDGGDSIRCARVLEAKIFPSCDGDDGDLSLFTWPRYLSPITYGKRTADKERYSESGMRRKEGRRKVLMYSFN